MLSPISHPPAPPPNKRAHSHHHRPSHGSGLRPVTSMARSNSYNTQYQPLPHRSDPVILPPTPDPSPPSSKQLASPVAPAVKTIPLSTGETPPRSAPPSTRAKSPVDLEIEPPTRPLRRSTMILSNEREEERFMSGAAVSNGTMSLGREQGMGALEGLEGKVVLLGSQGVGKTSLILRYTTRAFADNTANVTVGASLFTRKLVYEGVRVRLQIWDTAGQERFRSMAPMYYRGAHAAILVYDVTDAQSFTDVQSWLDELRKSMPTETVIHIVGAKLDLQAKRAISLKDACKTVKLWMCPTPAVPTPPTPPLSPVARPTSRTMFRSPSLSSRIVLSSPALTPGPTAVATPSRTPGTPSASTSPPKVTPSPPRPIPTSNSNSNSPFPFPTLTSPTSPTFTSPASPLAVARPTLVSATSTANVSRHATSGGRFSISNRLGIGRANSVSAAATLARTVEAAGPLVLASPGQESTSRSRADTLNMLTPDAGRRKSEDWSGRSWRTGGGPGVAEGLGEFGEGVRRRGSGSLLMRPAGEGFARRFAADDAERVQPAEEMVGVDDGGWGRLVEGVRVGECSAKTGEGIEALFLSIASILVSRRERIEFDRRRRERESVVLPSSTSSGTAEGRKDKEKSRGCC